MSLLAKWILSPAHAGRYRLTQNKASHRYVTKNYFIFLVTVPVLTKSPFQGPCKIYYIKLKPKNKT